MNVLNKSLGTENSTAATLNPVEAFAAIILIATAPDSYLSNEQVRSISFVLSQLKLFTSYSQELLNSLFDRILGILQRDGFNALFNLAKESLSQDLREAAFAVAADLVLAEGKVTEEEKNFLNDLYLALSIPPEVGIPMLQALLIKNQAM